MLDCRALFEPTNDLPQSETILLNFPLQLIKHLMQLIVESVVRSFEISRRTALTKRQVKSKIYRLDRLPWFLRRKAPMKSRPVVSKTIWFFLGNLSAGKSNIWGHANILQHSRTWQTVAYILFNNCSTAKCSIVFHESVSSLLGTTMTISFVSGCCTSSLNAALLPSRIMGWRAVIRKLAFSKRPRALNWLPRLEIVKVLSNGLH